MFNQILAFTVLALLEWKGILCTRQAANFDVVMQ